MTATRLFLMLCGLLIASAVGAADGAPTLTPTPTSVVEAAPSAVAASTAKRIAYIEIDGVIDPGMSRYYRRAMDAAIKAKVDAVVVHLTTPGGRVDSAEEMVKAALSVPEDGPLTVAFVDNQSYSAGSLIAFAHRRVYLSTTVC